MEYITSTFFAKDVYFILASELQKLVIPTTTQETEILCELPLPFW